MLTSYIYAKQDFLDDLASRVQTLQSQNTMLLVQMAGVAKAVNAAVVENQILKAEIVALEAGGTPSATKQPVSDNKLIINKLYTVASFACTDAPIQCMCMCVHAAIYAVNKKDCAVHEMMEILRFGELIKISPFNPAAQPSLRKWKMTHIRH